MWCVVLLIFESYIYAGVFLISLNWKRKLKIQLREKKLFITADAIITNNRGFRQIPDLNLRCMFQFCYWFCLRWGTLFVASCLCRGFRQCPKVIFIHFLCPFYKFIILFFTCIVVSFHHPMLYVCFYKKELTKMRHKRHTSLYTANTT